MFALTIPGPPIAKKRPRFARIGKGVRTYSAQETEEGRFLWEVKAQWQGKPLCGPVSIEMLFSMPIPKSTSKRSREAMLCAPVPHCKKPDLDNLVKFAWDCLNGIVLGDDSQVYQVSARKIYGDSPCTRIVLSTLQCQQAPLLVEAACAAS